MKATVVLAIAFAACLGAASAKPVTHLTAKNFDETVADGKVRRNTARPSVPPAPPPAARRRPPPSRRSSLLPATRPRSHIAASPSPSDVVY
jgi:hypothetical protein